MASKIEDYAMIGDCETAALVDREGSIDWLCWPDFSSSACFAALLGREENGFWKIAPAGEGWKSTRKYRDHTLILETTFENAEGAVRLIDFMPIRERNSDVVRIVEGIRGKMDLMLMDALAALRLRPHRSLGDRASKMASAPSPARTWPCSTPRCRFTART